MAKGDHIRVKRLAGLYTHHGIDMGDGTVIHFAGEPLRIRDAAVQRDAIEDFLRGGKPQIVQYPCQTLAPETVLETAASFLGQTGYDLWTNNCEHFACYCKTGTKKSSQIRRIMRGAVIISAGITITAAGLVIRRIRKKQF